MKKKKEKRLVVTTEKKGWSSGCKVEKADQ